MWLYEYLNARSDMSRESQHLPENSFECVFKWSTCWGLRTSFLGAAGTFLEKISEDYHGKFHTLPSSILTRAMMFCGAVIAPIALIPILLIDLTVLLSMFSVFAVGCIVGGGVSAVLAGLAWVFAGDNAAEETWTKLTTIVEDILFFVLNILRIPAGIANVVGSIPSILLELVTEGLNYICVSALYAAYNCRSKPALATPARANEYSANQDRSPQNDIDPEIGVVPVARIVATPAEEVRANPPMLSSYTSNIQFDTSTAKAAASTTEAVATATEAVASTAEASATATESIASAAEAQIDSSENSKRIALGLAVS